MIARVLAAVLLPASTAIHAEQPFAYDVYYLGMAYGSEQQYSVEAALDHGFDSGGWFSLNAVHARSEHESGPRVESTGIGISLGQSLKQLDLSLNAEWIGDSGQAETRKLGVGARYQAGPWRFGLGYAYRDSEFELQDFDTLLRQLDALLEQGLRTRLQQQYPQIDFNDLISLDAELDLSAHVYSANLAYRFNERWRSYLEYSHYEYSRPPGQLALSAGLNRYGETARGQRILARINQGLSNSLGGLAGDFQTGLYDYSLLLSTDLDIGEQAWTFEYGLDRDAIDNSDIHNFTLEWLRPIGSSMDLRLALGASDTRELGSVAHLAVGIFIYR